VGALVVNLFVMLAAQQDQVVVAIYICDLGSPGTAWRLCDDVAFFPEDGGVIITHRVGR
jgi:hypothetical protein